MNGKRVLVVDSREIGEVHLLSFSISVSTPRILREAFARSLNEGKTVFKNVDFDNEITDGLVDPGLDEENSKSHCEQISEYFASCYQQEQLCVTGTPFDFVVTLVSA